MGTTKSSTQIVELQSVRGIAASAVMIGHALIYYDTPAWFFQVSLLANGRAAVVIFFVLSGYVLTRSLRHSAFDRDSVLRFYVQRFFRIYPAIWAASSLGLLYIFLLHWQIPVDHEGALIRRAFRVDRFDALHIAVSLAGMTTFILPPLWTIFIEIVASIFLPGIAFLALRRREWFAWLLLGGVVLSFSFPDTYYHTTLYLMDFIIGASLTLPSVIKWFEKLPARAVVAVGFVAIACTQYVPLPYYSPLLHLGEVALAALIIGTLIGAKQRVPILGSRFLLLIGDTSYSIYLYHFVVLCVLAKMFAVLHLELDLVLLSLLLAGLTALITVPLAWASYTYIEKPGIALGKRSLQQMRLANAS